MKLELTDEQFKELVFLAMVGEGVRGGVLDSRGEYDPSKHSVLVEYLFQKAHEARRTDITELFHGHVVPSDAFADAEEELMEEYNDDHFWFELTNRLGQRDFEKNMTDDERHEAEEQGWLPERVREFYERYEREFEEYGVERLELKEG